MTWPRGVLTLATAALVVPRLQVINPKAAALLPTTCYVVMVSLLLPWTAGPWLLSRYREPTTNLPPGPQDTGESGEC